MATARAAVRRTRTPVANPANPAVDIHKQLTWEYVDIHDIVPYDYNPRDNEKAIPEVMESIKLVGFVIPVVIDTNNILVAGHTRIEAAKLLGMEYVPAIRANHCTKEQLDAFRLIDNKVSESASWNFDLLGAEVAKLADSGIEWTKYGWSQEEIDCLSDVVAGDCLTPTQAAPEAAGNEASNRRAPINARFVLGEFVFFIPLTAFRTWADGIRQLHDFNETAIINDIKRRLGVVE